MRSIQQRDRVLRSYLEGRTWGLTAEESLRRVFLMASPRWPRRLQSFRYLYDLEWPCEEGRGDVVLTDGKGRFAVLEFKHIDLKDTGPTARTRRTRKRREVFQQALRYADAFVRIHPKVSVAEPWVVTNEHIWWWSGHEWAAQSPDT